MLEFAKIEAGFITTINMADQEWVDADGGMWIDVTGKAEVAVGWAYNGSIFIGPVVVAPIPEPVTILTLLAFRSRFTLAEKQVIYIAAETSVDVRIFLDDLSAASKIDLEDLRTIDGVESLEASGLLAMGRAAEILAS